MLKQVVEFEDFDGNQQTEELYFHLTRKDMVGMLDLQPRLEAWATMARGKSGGKRELTTAEVQEFFDILETLMEKSYGQRSEDGREFTKSEEIWKRFTSTAAYDAYLFSLLEDPEKAIRFMINIMPKQFVPDMAEIDKQIEAATKEGEDGVVVSAPIESIPSVEPEKEIGEYTREELLEMPKAQFEKLAGRDPSKMSREVLQIAFLRRNKAGDSE